MYYIELNAVYSHYNGLAHREERYLAPVFVNIEKISNFRPINISESVVNTVQDKVSNSYICMQGDSYYVLETVAEIKQKIIDASPRLARLYNVV